MWNVNEYVMAARRVPLDMLAIRQELRARLKRSVHARHAPTLVHMEIRQALFQSAVNEQQVHGILSDWWQW